MSEFAKDYEMGAEFEERVVAFLQKTSPTATRINNKFSDYDILIAERDTKIECKYDKKATETGNIFIELQDNGYASGLLKSKADYFYIDTGVKLYCLPLMKLVECLLIEKITPTTHSVNNGDYDREMTGCIVPISTIERYSVRTLPTLMKLN